jgi:hypothetical protein
MTNKLVQKYINFFLGVGGGRSAGQCIRLFKKIDPNPQCWTSHFGNFCLKYPAAGSEHTARFPQTFGDSKPRI